MKPTPVDVSKFGQELGLADPIIFQRRANQWLSALRAIVGTIDVGGTPLDPLDALRSELNLQMGRALEFVAIARGLASRFPASAVSLGAGEFASGVASAMRLVPNGPVVARAPRWQRAREEVRVQAWLARRQLRHQLGAWRGGASSNVGQGAVLIVARSPDHLLHVGPIARELMKTHGKPVLFGVGDEKMAQLVEQAGFATTNLFECTPANPVSLAAKTIAVIGKISSAMRRLHSNDFEAGEAEAMKGAMSAVLRSSVPDLLRLASGVLHVFERTRPSIVIAANPYTLEGRAGWRLASACGIPSAAVEHGTIFANDPIWDELEVDTFLAWGEHSREALLACGMRAEQIAVVGSPRLDDELGKTRKNRSDRPRVLVATSGPGDQISLAQHQAFIDMLYEAAAAVPQVHWVVKLHRKDRVAHYTAANQRGAGARVEVVPFDASADIFDFLEGARAMVTIASAAALEAMVARVPVITVQASAGGSGATRVEFIERGCTRHVTTAGQLAAEAERACDGRTDRVADEAARQYATAHFANIGVAAIVAAKRLVATVRRA